MLARWVTFLVWAGVAASAVAWGLQVFVQPLATPPQAQVADATAVARGDLTRLFGDDPPVPVAVAASAAEPAADARFQLVGVVSPRSPQAVREGLALIAVDGRPPRAYRVGAVVDGPNVLQAVNPRGATLGPRDGAALVALKLPPPAPAATGVLAPLAGRSGAAPRQARPGVPTAASPSSPAQGQDAPEESDEGEAPPPPAPDNSRSPLR